MKKIDNLAATAFKNKHKFKSKNTDVLLQQNGEVIMLLFGNLIAKTEKNDILIRHCNWITSTTRNRLNALGAKIRMSKGEFIINEKFVMTNEWVKL